MAPRKPRYGRRQFRRRADKRDPKKAILIVCEGAVTEPEYFGFFKNELAQWLDIKIAPKSSSKRSPQDILEKAKEEVEKRTKQIRKANFDSVWCVMDIEIDQDETLQKTIQEAAQLTNKTYDKNTSSSSPGYNIVLSNPDFEYWLLLHCEKTDRAFGRKDTYRQLKTKHWPWYYRKRKGVLRGKMQSEVSPKIKNAVAYARKKFGNFTVADIQEKNASTHVYKLVEELQSQSLDYK